ncbi:hypothetical protein ACLOJK_035357 [Asimina triloba]
MEWRWRSWLWEAVPYAAMVVVEMLDVGLTTLSKRAMSAGMSHFVYVVYSNILASFLLLPSSFFLHTRRKHPPLTFGLLCRFFLLALVGITVMQNCVFTGVSYSSPTLASAMANLVPAFTFVVAILLSIHPRQSPPNSLTKENWVIGGLFLATASLSLSVWNNLQTATVNSYPAETTIVAFNCFFGTIQCLVVSLIAEKDADAWTLRPGIELVAIGYSHSLILAVLASPQAVFGSVVTYNVQTWCMHKKGPVFVAVFKPVGIAIAAMMSAIFLGDALHLGSVIGAVIIIVGFYGVMWGQTKEQGKEKGKGEETSSSSEAPLLQDHMGI